MDVAFHISSGKDATERTRKMIDSFCCWSTVNLPTRVKLRLFLTMTCGWPSTRIVLWKIWDRYTISRLRRWWSVMRCLQLHPPRNFGVGSTHTFWLLLLWLHTKKDGSVNRLCKLAAHDIVRCSFVSLRFVLLPFMMKNQALYNTNAGCFLYGCSQCQIPKGFPMDDSITHYLSVKENMQSIWNQ